ncbi:MAG: DUF5995 family protein [Actinomycetota bacterium]
MKAFGAAGALALALAASGCGSQRPAASPTLWKPPALCERGGAGCVALVAAEMTRRYRRLAASCDHDAAFALMYLRVTQAVGRDSGFDDRGYLARLDSTFAALYFRAFDEWRAGRRDAVPPAWQIAFEAARRRRASGIGDLLLGMNAHISRDLPFAVAALGVGRPAGRRSFEQVNALLERVARPMLREQARLFDPTVTSFALPVLSASPGTLGTLLADWRDRAMRDAERLLGAKTAAARAVTAESIERTATARAALIAAATSRVPYSPAGKARDAFCDAHHGAPAQ